MDREFKLSALHNQVFGPDYEIGGLKYKDKRRLEREKREPRSKGDVFYKDIVPDWERGLKKPSVKVRKSKLIHSELYKNPLG